MNGQILSALTVGLPIIVAMSLLGVVAWYVLVKAKFNKIFRVYDRKGNFRDYEGKSIRNKSNKALFNFEVKDFHNPMDVIEPHGWINGKKLFLCTTDHNGDLRYLERDFIDKGNDLYIPKENTKTIKLKYKTIDEDGKPIFINREYMQVDKFDINFSNIEKYDLRPEQKERIARRIAQSNNKYGGEANKALAGMLWTLGITIFLLIIAIGWTFTQLGAIGESFTSASSTFAEAYERQTEREAMILQIQSSMIQSMRDNNETFTFQKTIDAR